MPRLIKKEDIKVWRTSGIGSIDFRMGNAVSEPYPKHWHEEYQFCLITDGGGELNYRGTRHDTPTSSLFVVHPGEIHSNDTKTGCSFRTAYVDQVLMAEATASPSGTAPYFGSSMVFNKEVVQSFYRMHVLAERGIGGLEFEASLVSFAELLALKANFGCEIVPAKDEPVAVKTIQEYIAANYDRSISLRDLASLVELSPFHLSRIFSHSVGIPPHAFQTQVRVSVAKRSLRDGRSVADAAAQAGFSDQSHFHRHFRRLMKVTPGEYLRNSKNVQS